VNDQDGYLVAIIKRVSKLLLTVIVKNNTEKTTSQTKKDNKTLQENCKYITFDGCSELAGHASLTVTTESRACEQTTNF